MSVVLGVAALLFVFAPPPTQPALPDECRNLRVAGIEITDELALGPLEVDLHERCATTAATSSASATPSPTPGKTSPVSRTPGLPPTSGSSAAKPSTTVVKAPPAPKAAPEPVSKPISQDKARALAKADGTEKKRRWALVTLLLVVGTGVVLHRRST